MSIMPGKRKKNQKECESKILPNTCKSKCICEAHILDNSEINSIQENLLEWFDKEQRSLPWRDIAKNETDENIRGYSVWVSEVMLQQTQVATVIPYFNKWIKKWPSVKDLAGADLEEVLQTWAGLGYYSRGRRLHEGAKIVMEKLQGRIPQDVSELTKVIPGIGAYSAAAIASVAFRKVAGVVDGNVIRVLSRMRVIGQPASVPNVRDHLWKLANQLVSRKRPGDFNQALMELGAMVCTPHNPSCASCPVSSFCHAYLMTKTSTIDGPLDLFLKNKEKNRDTKDIPDIENAADCSFCVLPSVWKENPQVTTFPLKAEKKSPRKETVKVVVIEHSDKFLTVRRPEKGLLAGLLEFPSLIVPEGCSDLKSNTLLQPLVKEFGISKTELKSKKHVGEIVHLFSHIHTTYDVEHLVLSHPLNTKDGGRETLWISDEEIKTAAISTAMKKVFSLVRKSEKKPATKVPNKKRKTGSEDSKQSSIKSFFS